MKQYYKRKLEKWSREQKVRKKKIGKIYASWRGENGLKTCRKHTVTKILCNCFYYCKLAGRHLWEKCEVTIYSSYVGEWKNYLMLFTNNGNQDEKSILALVVAGRELLPIYVFVGIETLR